MVSPQLTLTDPDNTTLADASVTIGGFVAGDVLTATTTNTNITASYDLQYGFLTLYGNDTVANYQQVLDSVTYQFTGADPTNSGASPTRTISWGASDGLADSASPTTSISVAALALSNLATTTSFIVGTAPVALSPVLTVSDANKSNLASATVQVAVGALAGDVLAATTAGTSIKASYNSSSETLTLSGNDTLAHYQAVLRSITFSSSSPDPTHSGADPSRTVTWVLNDGSAASGPVTTTVNIKPLPTLTVHNDASAKAGQAISIFPAW